MINKAKFFEHIRVKLYRGKIKNQSVIDGLVAILDRASALGWPLTWTAYLMATVYHETAHTFAAIREYGRGRGRKYAVKVGPWKLVYYGRGWPQLTWLFNYEKQEKKLGIPLVKNPDLMLNTEVSAKVTFGGMADGDFTGRKLSQYFSGTTQDSVEARRIINGKDRAHKIATYFDVFLDALEMAQEAPSPAPRPKRTPKNNPDSQKDTAAGGGAVAGGGTAGATGGDVVPADQLTESILFWGGLAVVVLAVGYLCWRNREHIFVNLSLISESITKGK